MAIFQHNRSNRIFFLNSELISNYQAQARNDWLCGNSRPLFFVYLQTFVFFPINCFQRWITEKHRKCMPLFSLARNYISTTITSFCLLHYSDYAVEIRFNFISFLSLRTMMKYFLQKFVQLKILRHWNILLMVKWLIKQLKVFAQI